MDPIQGKGIFQFEYVQSLRKMLMDLAHSFLQEVALFAASSDEYSYPDAWTLLLDTPESWKLDHQRNESEEALTKYPQIASYYKNAYETYVEATLRERFCAFKDILVPNFHVFLHEFYCRFARSKEARNGAYLYVLNRVQQRCLIEEIVREIFIEWCAGESALEVTHSYDMEVDEKWDSVSQIGSAIENEERQREPQDAGKHQENKKQNSKADIVKKLTKSSSAHLEIEKVEEEDVKKVKDEKVDVREVKSVVSNTTRSRVSSHKSMKKSKHENASSFF